MGLRRFLQQLGLPSAFWILWTGTLITRFGEFVAPMLTFYLAQELELPAQIVGFILMGHGAAQMCAALLGGSMADRWGRRKTMLLSLLGAAALMSALGYFRNPWIAGLCVLGVGLVGNLYRPACQAAIADICAPKQRGRAFAIMYWGINLGAAAAPILGGWLASFDYGLLFYGDGATSAAFALLLALAFRDHYLPKQKTTNDRWSVWRDRPFRAFFAIQVLFALVFMQHAFALTTRLMQEGHSTSDYGTILGVNGISIIVIQPLVTGRLLSMSRRKLMSTAGLLAGVAMAGHGLAVATWQHMLCVFIWTLGEIVWFPLCGEVVSQLAPADRRGAYQGVFSLAWGISATLAPALAGCFAWLGYPSLTWWGCLVGGVAIAISSYRLNIDQHVADRQALADATTPALA